jgi:hypothetical protein
MANYLITGYWGEPHVTAENDRGFNAAVFGPGRFVLPVGEKLRAEYIGNNTIRLYDGKLLDGGALAGIPAGTYIDLLIPEAGQGMKRNDLIVFQYRKDASTLVESGDFVVVRGTETSGTPEDPALSQQDILSGSATADQMVLYRVPINGATIGSPVQMFTVAGTLAGAAAVPRNLLDNSNFTNPINQRRSPTNSYRGLGYSIDRWIVPSDTAALTIGTDFILIQSDSSNVEMFTQRLEPGTLKQGEKYTAVIWLNDGTVLAGSGTCASGAVNLTDANRDVYAQISPGSTYDSFRLCVAAGKFARIKHCALYEGEFSPESVSLYNYKSYACEFHECCRYFYRIPHLGAYAYPGYVTSANNARCTILLPIEMRKQPTFSVSTMEHAQVFTTAGLVRPSGMTLVEMFTNAIAIDIAGTYSAPASTPATVRFGAQQAIATLSADL